VTKTYYEEPRPARKIPTKEQIAHARRQAAYEAAEQEADTSYSGHYAGFHPEHKPFLTDERTKRIKTNTSVALADEYELEEDPRYYEIRPRTSSRRYHDLPDVTTRKGNVRVVEHYHDQPLRAHRQQLPPPRQDERYTDEIEEIRVTPQRRLHPVFWPGIFGILLISGWIGLNYATAWYQNVQNDWT
jgi:hypothetical protein